MHVELPRQVQAFLHQLVADGHYESEQAAVLEAVRLLESRERLRADIQVGLDDSEAGRVSDEEAVFSRLKAKLDRLDNEQRSH